MIMCAIQADKKMCSPAFVDKQINKIRAHAHTQARTQNNAHSGKEYHKETRRNCFTSK